MKITSKEKPTILYRFLIYSVNEETQMYVSFRLLLSTTRILDVFCQKGSGSGLKEQSWSWLHYWFHAFCWIGKRTHQINHPSKLEYGGHHVFTITFPPTSFHASDKGQITLIQFHRGWYWTDYLHKPLHSTHCLYTQIKHMPKWP